MTFFLFLRDSNDRQLPHTDRVLHAREPRHRRLLTQSRKFEWSAIEKGNECENRAIGESTVEIAPFTWLTAAFGDFMVEHKVQRESRVQEVVGVPELRVEAENNTSELHRLTLLFRSCLRSPDQMPPRQSSTRRFECAQSRFKHCNAAWRLASACVITLLSYANFIRTSDESTEVAPSADPSVGLKALMTL